MPSAKPRIQWTPCDKSSEEASHHNVSSCQDRSMQRYYGKPKRVRYGALGERSRAMTRDQVLNILLAVTLLLWIPASTEGQSSHSKLDGMWSDPPSTAVGEFCAAACTDAGIHNSRETANRMLSTW